ncbi:MAG: hypothetical protein KME35_20660 [Aphanocapsa sp. GSE-SYN-MK-11-07L]|jgi:hypothetical protein|nr:hypothetical protein [Aphanocapsa sp. GSE-SYN-MK-11-07L]
MVNKLPIASLAGLPEVKLVIDQGLLPGLKTRSTTIHAFLSIQPPPTADEDFWKAVQECLLMAGAGALVAGMTPGGMLALPTFMRMFGAHAASKGLELVASQFQLVTETTYGEWI